MKQIFIACICCLAILFSCKSPEKSPEASVTYDCRRKKVESEKNLAFLTKIKQELPDWRFTETFQYGIDYAHCTDDVSNYFRESVQSQGEFWRLKKAIGEIKWLDLQVSEPSTQNSWNLFIGDCPGKEQADAYMDFQSFLLGVGHYAGLEKGKWENRIIFSCGSQVIIMKLTPYPSTLKFAQQLEKEIRSIMHCEEASRRIFLQ